MPSPIPKREKLVDMLYGAILKSIMEGELQEGDRLPSEGELGEKYQVSRPTIREALARLRAAGVIISRQGSGTYVRQFPTPQVLEFTEVESIADLQRCYEFRLGIEGSAASLAAEMRDADDLERMQSAYRELHAALERGEAGSEQDFALHMAIARASKNHFFVSALKSIRNQAHFSTTLAQNFSRVQEAERRQIAQAEYQAIIDAIARQDAAAAGAAMKAHISRAGRRLFFGDRSEVS